MSRSRFPALVIALCLAVCAVPAVAGDEGPLRVMSFNIRYGLADDGEDSWEHRHDLVAATVDAFGPDLLGVQECLDFQAEFLRSNLPVHEFFGAGRDDGAQGGEMCAILYRAERFERLDGGHFWLSETPDVVASRSWDAALTRMATWVKLRTRAAEPDTFVFLNTHFDHVGEQARFESAQVIRAQLATIADGLPVIVTGDFNAPADAGAGEPYSVMTADGALVDTYRALHAVAPGEGTFNSFRGETDGARIDWILCSPAWSIREAAIVRSEERGRYPSDHFPVTARLGFE